VSATTVTVRPVRAADAAGVLSIYAPVVTDTFASFETVVPDLADMRRRIERGTATLPWLVAEDAESSGEGGLLGYAYAGHHRQRPAYRWSVDVSVYVAAAARGAGVGRLLYRPLLATLHELGYVTAFAGIALPNPASVALHEHLGFRHLGTFETVGYKHGCWRDVGWWRLALREPPPDAPGEPARWTDEGCGVKGNHGGQLPSDH